MTSTTPTLHWYVAALYRFAPLDNLADLRVRLREVAAVHKVLGTLIMAPEGINGTIAAETREDLDAMLDAVRGLFIFAGPGMPEMELKYSTATSAPFLRLKLKIKQEIVTMRQPLANPARIVGTYVEPADWNQLIADPDVLVVDTRNDYEYAEGTFTGALNPKTESFSGFADFVEKHLNPDIHKKIAMFCTGGIRCEKASSFMKAKGFEDVYHLKGGILKYLETVPEEQSTWEGRCYVFDHRETLVHGLKEAPSALPWGREDREQS